MDLVLVVVSGPLPGGIGLLPVAGHQVFPDAAGAGVYVRDEMTSFLDLHFVFIAQLSMLFAVDYLKSRGLPMAEFTATLLFRHQRRHAAGRRARPTDPLPGAGAAGPARIHAGRLCQAGWALHGGRAVKYFLLGSFSSAILLFGLALALGYTGSTRVAGIAAVLADVAAGSAPLAPGLAMGLALLTTGVAFKIAAVPFHYWTPTRTRARQRP